MYLVLTRFVSYVFMNLYRHSQPLSPDLFGKSVFTFGNILVVLLLLLLLKTCGAFTDHFLSYFMEVGTSSDQERIKF
jgi:hypothetical protein